MKKAVIVALALALALLPGTALAGGRGDNYLHPIQIGAVGYTSVHHTNKSATTQAGYRLYLFYP